MHEEMTKAREQDQREREALKRSFDEVKKGPMGMPGPRGQSVDFQEVVQAVTKQIRQPVDGKSPTIDALASALYPLLLSYIKKNMPTAKDGRDAQMPKAKDLVAMFTNAIERGDLKLNIGHINGLDGKFAEVRNAAALNTPRVYGKDTWERGGGDTVEAGTNITITSTVDGRKRISSSGGGGGSEAIYIIPGGLVNGINKDFTYTGTLKAVYLAGEYQTLGEDYTVASGVISFTYAPTAVVEILVTGSSNGQVPQGLVNGSNKDFTVTGPIDTVYLNGQKQLLGTDYTFSAGLISFTYAPAVNSTLYALYIQGATITTQTPDGLINGTNTVYTVTSTFNELFLAGAFQTPNVDYVQTGLSLAFTYPPTIGPLRTL